MTGESEISRSEPIPKLGKQDVALSGFFVTRLPDPLGDEIDLVRLWRVFYKARYFVIGFTILITALAVLIAFLLPPIYHSTVLLSPAASEESQGGLAALANRFGGLASLAGLNISGGAEKDEAIAVLKSRTFTEEFIRANNLMPVLFSDEWDAASGDWNTEEQEDIPSMADAFELFDEDVRLVTEDNEKGLVSVSVEWSDRVLAAEWANELVSMLNHHMRAQAISETEKSIKYLNAELAKTGIVDVQRGIYGLIEQQIETAMLANVREEYAFRVVDPAVISDEDRFVRPRRALIILVGFVASLLFSVLVVVFLNAVRTEKVTDS